MILDLLTYFAKFPKKEGVLRMFSSGRSEMPEYEQIKYQIEQLSEHSMLSIDGMIIAANFESIKTELDKLESFNTILFIDFGEVVTEKDGMRITDTWKIAVTVMNYMPDVRKIDLVEQAIIQERAMKVLQQLRSVMRKDAKKVSWLKQISDDTTAAPFFYPEWKRIGWSMILEMSGVGIWTE